MVLPNQQEDNLLLKPDGVAATFAGPHGQNVVQLHVLRPELSTVVVIAASDVVVEALSVVADLLGHPSAHPLGHLLVDGVAVLLGDLVALLVGHILAHLNRLY